MVEDTRQYVGRNPIIVESYDPIARIARDDDAIRRNYDALLEHVRNLVDNDKQEGRR